MHTYFGALNYLCIFFSDKYCFYKHQFVEIFFHFSSFFLKSSDQQLVFCYFRSALGNSLLFQILFIFTFLKGICLKGRLMLIHTAIFQLLVHSSNALSRWAGPGWSQAPKLHADHGGRNPSTRAAMCCFPVTLVGSWIGSRGETPSQALQQGCGYPKRSLNSMCHLGTTSYFTFGKFFDLNNS